jgi:hypothetical protein
MADFFVPTANPKNIQFIGAKFLTDANGNYVISPNPEQKNYTLYDANHNPIGTNTNGYIIVPANFNIQTAIDFGKSVKQLAVAAPNGETSAVDVVVAANVAFIQAFRPGGWLDIQTNYNGTQGDNVSAFRDGASYALGVAGYEAAYSLDQIKLGGGVTNVIQYFRGLFKGFSIDLSGEYGNNPRNVLSIEEGYKAQQSRIFGQNQDTPDIQYSESTNTDGLTQTQANLGSATNPIIVTTTINAQNNSAQIALQNPDGSQSQFSAQNGQLAAAVDIDAQNRVAGTLNISSNGSSVSTTFDTTSQQPWSFRNTVVDPQGRLIQVADSPDSGRVGWTDAQVQQFWSQYDSNGQPVGEPTQQVVVPTAPGQPPQNLAGVDIGSYLGSTLGQAIGGSNVFAHIAAGTVLSAFLSNVGLGLHGFNTGAAGAGTLTAAAGEAFGSFGGSLQSAFASQAVGAISSFLTGELAQVLHFDGSGFGSQLVRAETGTLLNTVLGNIATGQNPFLHLQGNLTDGASAFAGSYLAHLIAQPNSTIGQIGSSVGGWLGSAGELKVAEDYGRYLANKNIIDDVVALNPDSAGDFPAWQRMAVLGHSFEKRIN